MQVLLTIQIIGEPDKIISNPQIKNGEEFGRNLIKFGYAVQWNDNNITGNCRVRWSKNGVYYTRER